MAISCSEDKIMEVFSSLAKSLSLKEERSIDESYFPVLKSIILDSMFKKSSSILFSSSNKLAEARSQYFLLLVQSYVCLLNIFKVNSSKGYNCRAK